MPCVSGTVLYSVAESCLKMGCFLPTLGIESRLGIKICPDKWRWRKL
jgi:hypothetical protein